jgi:PPOX class probable F420-dependent enzyme
MTPTMTQAQIDDFLSAPRHAVVGTNPASGGAPQLSPVWYAYEGGRLYISTTPDTAKYHNLKRDPRISICVDGGREDVRAVMIYGAAQLIEGDNPLIEEMRWRIIRHYYDSEAEAREYLEATRDIDTALIVATPHRIISQDFN